MGAPDRDSRAAPQRVASPPNADLFLDDSLVFEMSWHLTIGCSNATLKASASVSLGEAGMGDRQKTKGQLVNELAAMRQRVAELEAFQVERERMEEALQESQARFKDLYENAPNAYFSVGVDGLIQRCNKRAGDLLGYTVEELVGRPVFELYADTPQGSGKARRLFRRFRAGDMLVDEELQMRKADGTPIWVSLTVGAVRDAHGQVVESRSMVVDITERKQAEEALRRERALLSQVMETSPVGITVVDWEGRITFANREAEQVLGLAKDEIVKRTYNAPEWRITDYDSGPFPDEELPFRRVMDTGQAVFDVCHAIERPDGRQVYLSINAAPLFDEAGQVDGMVATVEDITDRKQAEEALRRRNRELALLNQVGQKIIATLELESIAEQLLQALTETIGTEGASVWLWEDGQKDWLVCRAAFQHVQSRPIINLRLRPGQGIAGWVAQHGQSVITRAYSDPRFFPGIDEQIGFRTISLLAVPLRVRDVVIGVVEAVNKRQGDFGQDDLALVETMAASAAIALDNAWLIETLRRRNAELEARNEELDAFAHTVAHDLKNTLGVITGLTGVLEEDYASMPGEELKRYLRVVAQNGRKINSIVDELLLLAVVHKLEEVEMRSLDMASIVAEAQQRLVDMIEEHQVEIVLPDVWPVALGYGPWVEEIWVNYINNAIKYGGQPPRVELGADPPSLVGGIEGEQARFWVRDNGPGLTPEEQSQLFTSFTRLDQVRVQGYGLGLSIVRRIAEKLGGQVGVESEMGRGSVFYFTLPDARDLGDSATSGSHNSLDK
jgi:PAS domain S-box-containing protein